MDPNLDELKANLRPELVLGARPIDEERIKQISNHQFFNELIEFVLLQIDEDDAGSNV